MIDGIYSQNVIFYRIFGVKKHTDRGSLSIEQHDDQALADKLGINVQQYRQAVAVYHALYPETSLDGVVGDDETSEIGDFVTTTSAVNVGALRGDPETEFAIRERRVIISQMLDQLKPREREVLIQRFSEPPRTLQEVGTGMRLTRERVRQIEKKGLKRSQAVLQRLNDPNNPQRYSDWHIELES